MKIKTIRWFAALLIAYAMFALLSYLTFAQDDPIAKPKPQPKIVYEKVGDEWHWWVKNDDGAVVAESWKTFPNKGSAQDDWQRLRVIAGRDPDEEVLEKPNDRRVPSRVSRNVPPPLPSAP